MGILNWFTGLFSDEQAESENVIGTAHDSTSSGYDDSAIDPAYGLPMLGGEDGVDEINPASGLPMVGAVDVKGNAYGTNSNHDSFSSGIDDSFGSSFDDSLNSGGAFDDW